MIFDVANVRLSFHAVQRFQKRWRPELAHRDAARELYYAVERSKKIRQIDGGVLYETDDLEQIPIVIREHRSFKLVVSVLPAEARTCTDEELEEFAAFGRLALAEMPVDKGQRGMRSIRRDELTPDEVLELVRIERETAIALEEVRKYEHHDSAKVISRLREQIANLKREAAAQREVQFVDLDKIDPSDPIMMSKTVAALAQARKNDKRRHDESMTLQLKGKSEVTRSLRIAVRGLLAVVDAGGSYEIAESASVRALDEIREINECLISEAFIQGGEATRGSTS